MPSISIRVFVDDAEFDRIDADLPAETARDIVDNCKQMVEEHRPLSPEEAKEIDDAWASFLNRPPEQRRTHEDRQRALEKRRRAEEARAERMLRERGWRVEKPD